MEVVERMEYKIALLKVEVERRGYPWNDEEPRNANGEANEEATGDREVNRRHVHRNTPQGAVDGPESNGLHGGRLGDEELSRRLREQLDEAGSEDEAGVHL